MEKSVSFDLIINGVKFEVPQAKITGKEVLEHADLHPVSDYELLIKVTEKELQPVELNEIVDLSNPGIEHFFASPYRELTIHVDDEPVKVKECFMTPVQILEKVHKKSEAFYLKQILEHKEINYKNDVEHKIAMKNHQRFSTCKREGTTVS